MLKIVLYAYSLDIIGSRPIEYQCLNNTIFMALGCSITPDHSKIADFISSMYKEIIEIFTRILLYCDNLGRIRKEMFAVDGCKLPSNASKEMSGTFKDFENKIDKTKRTSEKNCKYLDINNIDGYIPDNYFRQRDPRFPEKNEKEKGRICINRKILIIIKKKMFIYVLKIKY